MCRQSLMLDFARLCCETKQIQMAGKCMKKLLAFTNVVSPSQIFCDLISTRCIKPNQFTSVYILMLTWFTNWTKKITFFAVELLDIKLIFLLWTFYKSRIYHWIYYWNYCYCFENDVYGWYHFRTKNLLVKLDTWIVNTWWNVLVTNKKAILKLQ